MLKVVIVWKVRSPLLTDVRWPVSDDVSVVYRPVEVLRSVAVVCSFFFIWC